MTLPVLLPATPVRVVRVAKFKPPTAKQRDAARWPRPEATNGEYVSWFIEKNCTHTKGELFGEPLLLEAWQRWLLDVIFEVDPETGKRIFKDVTIMLPRGNGKSTLAAALGFYFLLFDDEGGSEVISAATSKEQAKIVFDAAIQMRAASPQLSSLTKKFHSSIVHHETASVWKPIARLADAAQGLNSHAVIIDEYHVHKTGELREVLKRGQKKRSEPMLLMITTEAGSEMTPLGRLQKGFRDGAERETIHSCLEVFRDRASASILARWGVPNSVNRGDVRFDDESLVRACSPAEWLDPKRIIAEGLNSPDTIESDYARYDLNMLVASDGEEGFPMSSWDECANPAEIAHGGELIIGVDIGYRTDWSAVVAAGNSVGDDSVVAVKQFLFQPPKEEGMELDLEATVDAKVWELAEAHDGPVVLAADPALATRLLQQAAMRGIETLEYRFAWSVASADSVSLMDIVQRRKLAHDGDPTMRIHMSNLRVRKASDGAFRWHDHPAKKTNPNYPNDGGIALMIAVGEWARRKALNEERGDLITVW